MTAILSESFRHRRQREHEIDGAGCDGIARHPVELSLFRVLSDSQAAHLLDRSCPCAAIGAGSREDDADDTLPELLGERLQQDVVWHPYGLVRPGKGELKRAVAAYQSST